MVRRNNEEWKVCSVLGLRSFIRAVYPVKHLADYNYTGTLLLSLQINTGR